MHDSAMQEPRPSALGRDDTLFGVCQALGEDLGFNPTWLRIALSVALLWNPVAVIGGYFAAGVAVALLRWIVPNPAFAPASAEAAADRKAMAGDNDAEAEMLAAA